MNAELTQIIIIVNNNDADDDDDDNDGAGNNIKRLMRLKARYFSSALSTDLW